MSLSELRVLRDLVRWSAREYGSAVALEHASSQEPPLTFEELSLRARAAAGRIRTAGLETRSPVLLLLEPGPNWALGLFSILDAGLVAVPLTTETPPAACAAVAARTGCRAALCSERTAPYLADARDVEHIRLDRLFQETAVPSPIASPNASDTALLVFTSGSTDAPRAVELTHANLLCNLRSLLQLHSEPPGKAMLSMLPPVHMFEMMAGLFAPLVRGARVVYAGTLLPNRLIDALRDHRITHALAAPAL